MNKLATLLLITMITFHSNAEEKIDWRPMYLSEKKCEYRYEGCVEINEDELDFRSSAKLMLDNSFKCLNSPEGCTKEELDRMDEIRLATFDTSLNIEDVEHLGITARDLTKIIGKNDKKEEDHKNLFIPLTLTKSELITFAAATSLGLVVFHSDQEIMDFTQEHKTQTTQRIADVANLFGREMIPPIAIGSYFLGMIFNNGKLKQVGLITTTAGLATQLVSEAFKKSFGRVRPDKHVGPYEFGENGNKSFISGHSAAAFSLATVISEIYKEDHNWVPYVAYATSALTAYARVHDERHWASDVIFGALAGHLVTKIVIKMHNHEQGASGLLIYPNYNPVSHEFSLNVRYVGKRQNTPFNCEQMEQGPEKVRACIQEAYERSH